MIQSQKWAGRRTEEIAWKQIKDFKKTNKKNEKEKVGYSVNPSRNKVLEKLVSYLEKIKLDIQFLP